MKSYNLIFLWLTIATHAMQDSRPTIQNSEPTIENVEPTMQSADMYEYTYYLFKQLNEAKNNGHLDEKIRLEKIINEHFEKVRKQENLQSKEKQQSANRDKTIQAKL